MPTREPLFPLPEIATADLGTTIPQNLQPQPEPQPQPVQPQGNGLPSSHFLMQAAPVAPGAVSDSATLQKRLLVEQKTLAKRQEVQRKRTVQNLQDNMEGSRTSRTPGEIAGDFKTALHTGGNQLRVSMYLH